MLTIQQLQIMTDKPTPTTTEEKLMVVSVISFTITPTWTSITTPNGNCKMIATDDLVK